MDDTERVRNYSDRIAASKEQMRWDVFAASAAEGILAGRAGNMILEEVAWDAANFADAMMVERAKRINNGRA